MPKNIDDIIPKEKRSIRDIPIPEGRRKNMNLISPESPAEASRPARTTSDIRPPAARPMIDTMPAAPELPQREDHTPVPPPYRDYVPPRPKKSGYSRGARWTAVVVVLLVLIFGAFSFLSGATLTYVPKTSALTFTNDTYTGSKTADPNSGKLLFSVIQLTGDKGVSAPASGQAQVSNKASGTIVVYNNASSDAQKLIKNTRFQTTDGKIYRVATDITIPGKKDASTPGSLEITVTADQPGADYNIGLSDFTVPGLKGDPRYSTIYARSKTAMTGGFVGLAKKVSDADLATAQTNLEASLKQDLILKAQAQVPADYILFPDLSNISYQMLPQGSSTDTSVTVNERGNFAAVMFKKADLATYLGTQKLGAANLTSPVLLSDISGLKVSFGSSTTPDLLKADSVTFAITGSANLVFQTDTKALASDLAGKPKNSLDTTLRNYPSISSASATIQPFWKTSFPSDPTKIKIEENGQ